MKYIPKQNKPPEYTRIKRKLLIFPKVLNGEGRYLEIVYVNQEKYRHGMFYIKVDHNWSDVSFTTKEAYKSYKLTK